MTDKKAKHNLFIFGDSIMKGLIYSTSESRYLLSDKLNFNTYEQKYGISISNYSRVGFSVKKGFDMLKKYFDRESGADAVFIEYGGNDCIFKWNEVASAPDQEHLSTTPIDEFESTYCSMIDYLNNKNIKIVVANLPPICPERYT
jgi:lysophospholipase L1-like esterase